VTADHFREKKDQPSYSLGVQTRERRVITRGKCTWPDCPVCKEAGVSHPLQLGPKRETTRLTLMMSKLRDFKGVKVAEVKCMSGPSINK